MYEDPYRPVCLPVAVVDSSVCMTRVVMCLRPAVVNFVPRSVSWCPDGLAVLLKGKAQFCVCYHPPTAKWNRTWGLERLFIVWMRWRWVVIDAWICGSYYP